jgi:type I restriction enzyme S subunit
MTGRIWDVVRLADHCSKIGSGATPRGGESVYLESGVSFIRSQNVYNGYFNRDGLAFLDEDHAEQLKGVTVEPGDVLLNITGDSVARSCRVPDELLPARVNQHVAIIRPKKENFDSRFVGYFFTSPFMQNTMLSLAGCGGTRKALTKEMIERFEVPQPPRPVQARIADILSAYDDLIENNRRRMALLEDSARLLYREWFVRLRFPGYEHTRVVDGVPDGWALVRIDDFGTVLTGKTPATKESDNYGGDVPFVKTPDMHGQAFVLQTETYLTEKGAKSQANKFLPTGTLLVSCIGTVGVVSLTADACQFNQQINAVIPNEDFLRYYCYFALKGLKPRLDAIGGGVTMANVSKGKFECMDLLRPSTLLLRDFDEFCTPVFSQIKVLGQQNQKLRAARDLLLPRLMSGEIAV